MSYFKILLKVALRHILDCNKFTSINFNQRWIWLKILTQVWCLFWVFEQVVVPGSWNDVKSLKVAGEQNRRDNLQNSNLELPPLLLHLRLTRPWLCTNVKNPTQLCATTWFHALPVNVGVITKISARFCHKSIFCYRESHIGSPQIFPNVTIRVYISLPVIPEDSDWRA